MIQIWDHSSRTAHLVAQLGWVADGIDFEESQALGLLQDITLNSVELSAVIMNSDWFIGPISPDEIGYLDWASHVAPVHPGAVQDVLDYYWIEDGLNTLERSGLSAIMNVTSVHPILAQSIVDLQWVSDGLTSFEIETLHELERVVALDADIADRIIGYRWLQNSGDWNVMNALHELAWLAAEDVELANQVSQVYWLKDRERISNWQWDVIGYVARIAQVDRKLAQDVWAVAGDQAGWNGLGIEPGMLASLRYLNPEHNEAFEFLSQQPWFVDGFSRDEIAFLATVKDIIRNSPEDFYSLVETRHTIHKKITLPLSGDVNIWAIQKSPFDDGEDLLDQIELTLRSLEEMTQTPVPEKDVVVLVVITGRLDFVDQGKAPSTPWPGLERQIYGVRIPREEGTQVDLQSLIHGLADYHFAPIARWVTTTEADFALKYIWHREVTDSVEDWKASVENINAAGCFTEHSNLSHASYVTNGFIGAEDDVCQYRFNEHFWSSMYHALDQDMVINLLIQSHDASKSSNRATTWKDIYQVFRRHVQPNELDEFLRLFELLHGDSLTRDWTDDVKDIHGDDAATATSIEVGGGVRGRLDDPFDIDIFKITLDRGQTIRFDFEHTIYTRNQQEELYVRLYTPNNIDIGEFRYLSGLASRMQLEWIVPVTGDYFIALDSASGMLGDYTLMAIPQFVTDGEDDHGDDATEASEIEPDTEIMARLNSISDIDYFRIDVSDGLLYEIHVQESNIEFLTLSVFGSDGISYIETISRGTGRFGLHSLYWKASENGSNFIEVSSLDGDSGDYSFSVIETVPPKDDHGDDASTATSVEIGEITEGTMDNFADSDFFRFEAEEGHVYNILLNHITITFQSAYIYASDGRTVIHEYSPWGGPDPEGTLIPWIAPESSTYFLEFSSPDGDVGDYTLSILAANAVDDKHGDTPNSTTRLQLDETISGNLDAAIDFDYFEIEVDAGVRYSVTLDYDSALFDNSMRITLYNSDTLIEQQPDNYDKDLDGRYLAYIAPETRKYYLVVWNSTGEVGSYSVTLETNVGLGH